MKITLAARRASSAISTGGRQLAARLGLVGAAIAGALVLVVIGSGILLATSPAPADGASVAPPASARATGTPTASPTPSASATPTATPTSAEVPPPTSSSAPAVPQVPAPEGDAGAPSTGPWPPGGPTVGMQPACPTGALSIAITSGTLERTDTTWAYTVHGVVRNNTNWTAVVFQNSNGVFLDTWIPNMTYGLGMPSARWDIPGDSQTLAPGASVTWTLDHFVPYGDVFPGPITFTAQGYAGFTEHVLDASCAFAMSTGRSASLVVG